MRARRKTLALMPYSSRKLLVTRDSEINFLKKLIAEKAAHTTTHHIEDP
jgi:hypothetical protein